MRSIVDEIEISDRNRSLVTTAATIQIVCWIASAATLGYPGGDLAGGAVVMCIPPAIVLGSAIGDRWYKVAFWAQVAGLVGLIGWSSLVAYRVGGRPGFGESLEITISSGLLVVACLLAVSIAVILMGTWSLSQERWRIAPLIDDKEEDITNFAEDFKAFREELKFLVDWADGLKENLENAEKVEGADSEGETSEEALGGAEAEGEASEGALESASEGAEAEGETESQEAKETPEAVKSEESENKKEETSK